MRELLAQNGRMKRTTIDLVDWKDVDKMTENSLQQLCLWVTRHGSKCFATKKCYTDGEMQQMRYAPAA